MRISKIAFMLLFSFLYPVILSARGINPIVSDIIKDKKLKLGFAVKDMYTGVISGINFDDRFPMQSVYKFPISFALMHLVDQGKYKLTDSIEISRAQLQPDTWSPLREQYPDGVKLPLSEIIRYSVAKSDNNTSDIMFHMAGGADEIGKYLNSCRIWQINVKNTEQELHADTDLQFDNWATPWGMISLLSLLEQRVALSAGSSDFLWDVMASTETGSIKKKLPANTVVAHKTGSSGINSRGIYDALNDAGIIVMPSGRRIAYVIFITASEESEKTNYEVISDIGLAVYNYFK